MGLRWSAAPPPPPPPQPNLEAMVEALLALAPGDADDGEADPRLDSPGTPDGDRQADWTVRYSTRPEEEAHHRHLPGDADPSEAAAPPSSNAASLLGAAASLCGFLGVAGATASPAASPTASTELPPPGPAPAPVPPPEDRRPDWASGLPVEVLAKVAERVVAGTEAGWAAVLRRDGLSEKAVRDRLKTRKARGHGLLPFALVCRKWREAQRKASPKLRTRVKSDVILPGRAELVRWALAEGCPRERVSAAHVSGDMAHVAAEHGHLGLVHWLCGERGFAMDAQVMAWAAGSGNLELVRWLRAAQCPWDEAACARAARGGHLGILQFLRKKKKKASNRCPWTASTCGWAAIKGHVHVLRWARENGCPWDEETRDRAAAELGYTDNLGNLM